MEGSQLSTSVYLVTETLGHSVYLQPVNKCISFRRFAVFYIATVTVTHPR